MNTSLAWLRPGILSALVLSLSCLSGCGGSDDSVNEPAVADSTGGAVAQDDADGSTDVHALSVTASANGITTKGFPVDHQLFPRASIGDAAAKLSFTAKSSSATVTALTLTKTNGGNSTQQSVAIKKGQTITMIVTLPVGLTASDLKLEANTASGSVPVAQASDVVAGDVYVVQGQSNAKSTVYPEENSSADADAASPWIRTVGNMSDSTSVSSVDHAWHVARAGGDGDIDSSETTPGTNTGDSTGTIGKWPQRMARDLVDQKQVPIAIFNGAQGGERINYFLSTYVQPKDSSNNYKRLLSRLNAYDLAGSVRAVFYYQGEADTANNVDPTPWTAKFKILLSSWNKSFPGMSQVYLTQIRGCTSNHPGTISIREQQRRMAGTPKVQVMSTTAMGGFDGGCHFHYSGYQQLGHWYARLMAHDLYGDSGVNTTAPAPVKITRSPDGRQLLVKLANQGDPISADPTANLDFFITSKSGVIQPTDVTGSAGLLTLTLPMGVSAADTINVSYRGADAVEGRPWIVNGGNVGLLAFESIAVSP
jgi:hypothetical protein